MNSKFHNILFILLACFLSCQGECFSKPFVCLNMIVKNEKEVIERCLTSVLPLIDYWVIVDTGSTDGTQQMICDFMSKHQIPGELYERPWVNFEHNRNEALQLAKGKKDYLLFIDADEYVVFDPDFALPTLNEDYYYIQMSYGGTVYHKIQLIRSELPWKWEGVLHEVLILPKGVSGNFLNQVKIVYTTEGARSKDPQKFEKDAIILEKALEKDPENTRYVFYLAQSYRDSKNYAKARQAYEKRISMGGWDQEVFYSLLQKAILEELMGEPFDTVKDSYLKAFQYRSTRIEPLYYMSRLFRSKQQYLLGYQIAKIASRMPISKDILFLEQWMHDYGVLIEQSVCAYWIGNYEESQQLSLQILKREDLPSHIRTLVERNLSFANAKLVEKILK